LLLPDGRLQLLVAFQDVLATLVVGAPQRRQLRRPGRAVDQLNAEPLFQLQHDLADRRLRPVVGPRGLREAAVAGNITEHLERLWKLHGVILSSHLLIARADSRNFINNARDRGKHTLPHVCATAVSAVAQLRCGHLGIGKDGRAAYFISNWSDSSTSLTRSGS